VVPLVYNLRQFHRVFINNHPIPLIKHPISLINYPILLINHPNPLILRVIEMRTSILIMTLIASSSALSFNHLNIRATGTICDDVGEKCTGSEAPLCCDPEGPIGFAHCQKGKVKFTTCADGCGSEAGVIQCIANPNN
jgi:hypothetical protein